MITTQVCSNPLIFVKFCSHDANEKSKAIFTVQTNVYFHSKTDKGDFSLKHLIALVYAFISALCDKAFK